MTASGLKVGDKIKIVRIPPQVLSDRKRFPETFELFEKAVGRVYQIRDFGEYGHLELWLHDDGSEEASGGAHSIWVEPEYAEAV